MDAVPFHIGIATDDLGATMERLGAALGLSWTAPSAGPGVFHSTDGVAQPRPRSCLSRQGPVHIDLVEGGPGTIWEADAPRLHHVAYWTDDLAGDVTRLEGEGWRLELTDPDDEGRPSRFAYLVRPDNFRIELIDRAVEPDYLARLHE